MKAKVTGIRIEGAICVDLLERNLRAIVLRHDVLRPHFVRSTAEQRNYNSRSFVNCTRVSIRSVAIVNTALTYSI
jgi:hypothetical protein